MDPAVLLVDAMGLLLIGAVVTAGLAPYRKLCGWVAFLFVLAAAAALLYAAAAVYGGSPVRLEPPLLRIAGLNAALTVQVDGLGALFLGLIAFLGTVAALYSIDYAAHPHYARESLIRYYPLLLIFLASMVGVVVSWDLLFFIVWWELMTLASYVLVVFETGNPTNLRAGIKYFVMTHVATACMLVAAILLWRQAGSFGFEALRPALADLAAQRPALLHGVLLLFFVGFATKAALFPFGDWLPDAHPAAPSAISALLSGVMIKMGVYGLLRVFLSLGPGTEPIQAWGGIIAFFGTVSLFVCTLTALLQHDAKRLMAFHSMGQIGYVCLGLGIGLAFLNRAPLISALGLVAGLYHLVNHACFKGLLFLNAGAVQLATGTRDLDRLGGLWTLMPVTAGTALVASLAISGVPPLNGFASKWLLYQASSLAGLQAPVYLVWCVVALFISAATLASFVKFLGTAFLGLPSDTVRASLRARPPNADDVGAGLRARPPNAGLEMPGTMLVAQGVLALACIVLGVLPTWPVSLAHTAALAPSLAKGGLGGVEQAPGALTAELFAPSLFGLRPMVDGEMTGAWHPLWVLLAFGLCLLVPYGISRWARAPRRQVSVWLCGEEHRSEEVRYKAGGFYLPFRDLLSFQVGERRVTTLYPSLPLPRAGPLEGLRRGLDPDPAYYGLLRVVGRWCEWFSRSHVGVPQVYVLWMVGGAVLAIVVLFALS